MSLYTDTAWKTGEDLTAAALNRRAKAVADAIGVLEAFAPSWQAEVDALREVGLDRINTALLPAYQQVAELANLGAMLSADSATTVTISTGTVAFVVSAAKRQTFAPTPYLIAYADGDPDVGVIGTVQSYDNGTGVLVLSVTSTRGSGAHSSWTLGPVATTDDLEALRSQVSAWASQASADSAAAQAARVGAETAQGGAQSALSTFQASWYGPRTTPPSGAALGAQYLDTSTSPNVVKVLTASGWAPTVTISVGGVRRQDWTAAGGAPEVFTVSGGFSAGDVFVNGVIVAAADVTFNTGAGTFSTATVSGDAVAFRGYQTGDTVDWYSKAATNTLLDAKLNAAAYTAADVLAKVKTVDGSGSDLDADMLDGHHASEFFRPGDGALPVSAGGTGATNRLGALGALGLSGGSMSIADNGVASLDLTGTVNLGGFVFISGLSSQGGTFSAILWVRAVVSSRAILPVFAGAQLDVLAAGTNLTGTTGATGRASVSIGSDGKLYVENRRGADIIVFIHMLPTTAA